MEKTAELVKDFEARPTDVGTVEAQSVYKMTPPYEGHEYVMVSAANVWDTGPETYVFPCDSSGEVTDWVELPASFQGDLDHVQALANAGYTVKAGK